MALKKALTNKKKKKATPTIGNEDAVNGKARTSSASDEDVIPVVPAVKQYNVVSREASCGVSPGERQRLRDEAVTLIKQQIVSPPEAEKKAGKGPYVPRCWAKNYKPALGSYKKFVQEQSSVFVIVDETSDNFTIKLVGDPTAVSNETPWKRDLLKAWVQYAQKVPQGRRGPDHFMSVLQGRKSASSIFCGDFVKVPKGEYVQSLPAPPAPASTAAAAPGGKDEKVAAACREATLSSPASLDGALATTIAKAEPKAAKKKTKLKANGVKAAFKADSNVGKATPGAESRRQRAARLKATGGAAGVQHKLKKKRKG